MNPIETIPDLEVDQFTGKLKPAVAIRQDSLVISPINRNLLYTKAEVRALIPNITVSNTAPTSPSVGDLWVDTT